MMRLSLTVDEWLALQAHLEVNRETDLFETFSHEGDRVPDRVLLEGVRIKMREKIRDLAMAPELTNLERWTRDQEAKLQTDRDDVTGLRTNKKPAPPLGPPIPCVAWGKLDEDQADQPTPPYPKIPKVSSRKKARNRHRNASGV